MSDVVPRCTLCGAEVLEDGFIEDGGQSHGYARWIPGPLERGIFGGAKRLGRERLVIRGKRCTECGHLDLFALREARRAVPRG